MSATPAVVMTLAALCSGARGDYTFTDGGWNGAGYLLETGREAKVATEVVEHLERVEKERDELKARIEHLQSELGKKVDISEELMVQVLEGSKATSTDQTMAAEAVTVSRVLPGVAGTITGNSTTQTHTHETPRTTSSDGQ